MKIILEVLFKPFISVTKPENDVLPLVKRPVVVNNTYYPVKTVIRRYLKNLSFNVVLPFSVLF